MLPGPPLFISAKQGQGLPVDRIYCGGYMRFFRDLTIRVQLIISYILTILVVILIIFLSYSKFSEIMVNKNRNYTSEITTNIKNNIALYFKEIGSILRNIGYDTSTQKYVMEKDPINIYETGKELKILSINTVNIKKDILDIAIIGENGKYFTMSGMYNPVRNLMDTIPDDGSIYSTGFEKIDSLSGNTDGNMFIMYGMYIYSAYKEEAFGDKIGFAAVLVDLEPIFREISSFTANTEIKYYLVDKDGRLFSEGDPLKINNNPEIIKNILAVSSDDSKNNVITINGYENIVQAYEIPEIQGRIISLVPREELFMEIHEVRKIVLTICFAALILLSSLFLFITNNITHPVAKLISFMGMVKNGDIKSLKKKIRLEGYSEIKVLSNEFNNMLFEINNLTHRLLDTSSKLYEAEIVKEKAELAYLRSQINPHFLYNTLECLKGIASDEGQEKIYKMTQSLALVFRYCVNNASMVAMEDEFKIVKAYVQIHEIRFGERLTASYDFEERALHMQIPKMILQPIVENAIYHGFEPKRGKGSVHIGSRLENNKLLVRVKDDGVGIDAENLEELNRRLAEPFAAFVDTTGTDKKTARIGLYNVNNRIRLTYGNDYGLKVTSERDIGTEVLVTIPVKEAEHV